MRLTNPNNRDLHVNENKVLAVVSQVKTQNIFPLSTNSETTTNAPQCTKLKHTSHKFDFNPTNSDLDEQQKQKLLLLLNNHNGFFSERLHDLGRTHLAEHTIDTEDAPPVEFPH